jgi:hypothetical protein
MLLAFCLVSVSLWTYGTEATADALSDEIAHFFPTQGELPDPGLADLHCNLGCHAQSHLTGTECENAAFSPIHLASQEHLSVPGRARVPTRPNEGPFRPPRTIFQA